MSPAPHPVPCHICAGRGALPRYDDQGHVSAEDRCLSCAGHGYTVVECDDVETGLYNEAAEAIKRAALPPWEKS